ncbi:hypothetical protein LXL04_002914 [Taraxacum kok-saghyz]
MFRFVSVFFHRSVAETIWFSLYSFPEDAMFFLLLLQPFGIFYLCSASFRFCSTGLLLKPDAFLYMRTETMTLSDVSFPGISLEDSLRILFFLEDAMFFLLLFQPFGIFYLCSASFRFCSTCLLLKPSAFLYMRTETMSLSDVSFPGISLEDSPRITFVAEDETDILNGLLTVSVLPRSDERKFVAEHETDILNGLLMVSVLPRSDERTFVAKHETDILNGLLMVSVLPRISS